MITTSIFKLASRRAAVALFALHAGLVSAATPQHPWATMAQADADFITGWIERQSISAVYPDKETFAGQLRAARRVLDGETPKVISYAGYRHAVGHFVGALQDAHLRVRFSLTPATYEWPGFQVAYRGGRYFAVSTASSDVAGQEVTRCDGKPMDDWVSQVATYEQIITGLESTKALAAPLVFRDSASPFVARPRSCVIGGR